MANTLQGKKVAILLTDGFEQVELTKPRQALQEAGAQTQVVSPKSGKVKDGITKSGAKKLRLSSS